MAVAALLAFACHLWGCAEPRPPLPTGYGNACEADADCVDGLICILEVGPAGYQWEVLNTCGIPCEGNEACTYYATQCSSCEDRVDVQFCDFGGCK